MIEIPLEIAFQEPRLAQREEAAAGDERFAALVRRQSRFVFRVAYAILRNTHDAEDVVQETFLKLYRARKWESLIDEKAFLARAAWRIAVDRLRAARRNPGTGGADFEIASGLASPEQALIAAERDAAVHRLVDGLPEELRQPLALSAVEEMNSREIGEVMGIAEGTVRSRLMRARQILKQKLAVLMAGSHGKQ